MQYHELNDHFKEKIRSRIGARLSSSYQDADLTGIRDLIVGCIILLADSDSITKATENHIALLEQRQESVKDQGRIMEIMTTVWNEYETEVSILYDLYQMQERQEDIMDIIAHMELRLLEG